MNIAEVDAGMVRTLVGRGLVRNVANLYGLKLRELADLPDTNLTSAQLVFEAINASRKREGWRLLFGLSIPLIGESEARSLCQKFGSVDNVFAAGVERLIKADGIDEAAARSIVHWHGDRVNRTVVKRLLKAGLNFKS